MVSVSKTASSRDTARRLQVAPLLAWLVLAAAVLPVPLTAVRADSPPASAESETAVVHEEPAVTPVRLVDVMVRDRKAERRQAVAIGSTLLGLILATGLCLIGFVYVMGRRTRMLGRNAAQGCKPVDPLWFLKPRPPVPPSGETLTGEPRE